MKEPEKIRLDPETPLAKDVNKIPMPSIRKPEWDISAKDDGLFTSKDLDNVNKLLDEISNEDSQNSN